MENSTLTNFFGYKSSVTFKDGTEISGGTQVQHAMSSYGSNNKNGIATISASVVKALTLFACAKENVEPSTILNTFNGSNFLESSAIIHDFYRSVVEINTAPEIFDLATYNPHSGSVLAATLDRNSGKLTKFDIGFGKRNGTCILLAMLPFLLKDSEANQCYINLVPHLTSNSSGLKSNDAMQDLARISDNIYFRIKTGNVKLNIPEVTNGSETIGRPHAFTQVSLTTGAYAPNENDMVYGTLRVFVGNGTSSKKTERTLDIKKVAGKYRLNERQLQKYEERMVPVFSDGHQVSSKTLRICELTKNSTGKKRQFRNFLLEGPAGTGKSVMSREVAAALHLPHTHITCDAGTEMFNLIGQILPSMDGDKDSDDIAELMDLPTIDDIQFDLENSYYRLTGETELPVGMDVMECISILFKKQMDYMKNIQKSKQSGNDFTYIPSELVKGLKYGWVVEIQEPTVIRQAGVLAGLNDILDIESGIVQLPTGEIFKRHPDAVIICTTNKSYEGCRNLNQSVISRMQCRVTVDNPTAKELEQRALFDTDSNNPLFISECVKVMEQIQDYLKEAQIEDGICGPRELFDWIQETVLLNDVYEAAKETIVSKSSDEEEIREHIFREYIENVSFSSPEIQTTKK